MKKPLSSYGVLAPAVLAFLSLTKLARADVAPPEGFKYAQYGFRIDNVADFPNWTLVAYPCNSSSGRPYQAGTVLKDDGLISVGRRGGACVLYAMKAADWQSWRTANPAPAALGDDAALNTLTKSDRMLRCEGGPSPQFQVPTSAPDTITEIMHIQALTDASCKVVAASDAASGTPSQPQTGDAASQPGETGDAASQQPQTGEPGGTASQPQTGSSQPQATGGHTAQPAQRCSMSTHGLASRPTGPWAWWWTALVVGALSRRRLGSPLGHGRFRDRS